MEAVIGRVANGSEEVLNQSWSCLRAKVPVHSAAIAARWKPFLFKADALPEPSYDLILAAAADRPILWFGIANRATIVSLPTRQPRAALFDEQTT
jgi:hypothetical protein